MVSPSYEGPIIDVHHKKNYFVIPQNKLGQDIFVRATEIRGLPHVIKMPSGEKKSLKVPVSKNMLDSHLQGNLYKKLRSMVTIIISQAQVCLDLINKKDYLSVFVQIKLLICFHDIAFSFIAVS